MILPVHTSNLANRVDVDCEGVIAFVYKIFLGTRNVFYSQTANLDSQINPVKLVPDSYFSIF